MDTRVDRGENVVRAHLQCVQRAYATDARMYGCEQQTARGLSFIAQSEQTMDEKRVCSVA